MLTLTINGEELWNEITETFENSLDGQIVLELEHSLVSVSKWESKFEKPFLGKDPKTEEETLGYVELMITTPNVPSNIFDKFNQEHINQINEYIDSKQSAKTFRDMSQKKGTNEVVTSELIYYWMITLNIPLVCESWHLNRLFSLIRTCNEKNTKPEKMSKHAIAQRNQDINAQRRAELGTKG